MDKKGGNPAVKILPADQLFANHHDRSHLLNFFNTENVSKTTVWKQTS